MLVSAGVATGVLGAVLSVRNRRRVAGSPANPLPGAEAPRAVEHGVTGSPGAGERDAAQRVPLVSAARRG